MMFKCTSLSFVKSQNPSCFPHNFADTLEARLTGGKHYAAGRVEIKYNNKWMGMCADYFDNSTAVVICTQLGYIILPDVVQTFSNYTVPPKEAKIEYLPFQANCRPYASKLGQCTREYGVDCPSGEYATLKCAGKGSGCRVLRIVYILTVSKQDK